MVARCGEVSAVTRLRMTSIEGRRMRTASAGTSLALSICLRAPRETTIAGGDEGTSLALEEPTSLRTLLPNKVHLTQSPLDKDST